jgi:hypothetical protein
MTAGKPYLVRWGDYDYEFLDPVFRGVSINSAALQDVTFPGGAFKGTYDAIAFQQGNPNILLMGTDNTLFWPQPDPDDPSAYPTIGACRAYFELEGAAQAPERIVLNFNDNAPAITTNLEDVRGQKEDVRVEKVLKDGIMYIRRGGVVYDVLGRVIQER